MRHLLMLLVLTTTNLWSQNGIGAFYSMRIFPFQHRDNHDSYYLKAQNPGYDKVTVSNAFEHNLRFYYQFQAEHPNKIRQVGISIYSARLEFERNYSTSDHSTGNQSFYSKSGVYDYSFVGLNFGSFKNKPSQKKISLQCGYIISIHFLVYEHTYDKLSRTTYSSNFSGTGQDVSSAENIKFNAKLEIPLVVKYTGNQNSFSVGISPGISTQSRILVQDNGFNPFISPTISYTHFLKRKASTN